MPNPDSRDPGNSHGAPLVFIGRFDVSAMTDAPADVLIFATVDEKFLLPVWVNHRNDLHSRPSNGELFAAVATELADGEAWEAEFSTHTRGKFTVTLSLGQRKFDAKPTVLEPMTSKGALQEITISDRVRGALVPAFAGTLKELRALLPEDSDEVAQLTWESALDLSAAADHVAGRPVMSEREEELFQQMISDLGDFGLGDDFPTGNADDQEDKGPDVDN